MKSLINRVDSCIGITLFRFHKWNIELWFCPKGCNIVEHSHIEEDIELIYLFGSTVFWRYKNIGDDPEYFKPKWYHVGRSFSIPAGTRHWFTVSRLPLIFINVATFKNGIKPKSASIDFVT